MYYYLTGKVPNFSNLPNLRNLSLGSNQLTTVEIILEKESYNQGEQFIAELTETVSEDYDLYAAVLLANSTDFVTLEDTNKFTSINQVQKWLAPRTEKEITLIDLTLPTDIPIAEYCIYGILSPKDKPVFEV